MMHLPRPRGPLSDTLIGALQEAPRDVSPPPIGPLDPLSDDDLHLALYVCYELHYRGFDGVDDRWEWDPSLVRLRRNLEEMFESAVRATVDVPDVERDVPQTLRSMLDGDPAPSLSGFIERQATIDQFREFAIHRSAYQLKEADPHSWAIPRLTGKPKTALLEIQVDEYGSGEAERAHAALFARSMAALGLDPTYGAYLGRIPGFTLATVNLMSLFGLHRRLRGALVGHLAMFEMSSPGPNRRYANGLRRLGKPDAAPFFDEHVEADSVHEAIAAHDLAGGFATSEPSLADDVLFGAAALLHLEAAFATRLLEAWSGAGWSLLEEPTPAARAL